MIVVLDIYIELPHFTDYTLLIQKEFIGHKKVHMKKYPRVEF